MVGKVVEASPDIWPGAWYPLGVFITAPQTPAELRNWLQSGLDPRLQSFVWWAEAADNEGFALLYHQSVAQIGFWLSPVLRGRGWGKVILKRALGQLPADGSALVLATVARSNLPAHHAALGSGMRVVAAQKDRTIFCLDRNPTQVR